MMRSRARVRTSVGKNELPSHGAVSLVHNEELSGRSVVVAPGAVIEFTPVINVKRKALASCS